MKEYLAKTFNERSYGRKRVSSLKMKEYAVRVKSNNGKSEHKEEVSE